MVSELQAENNQRYRLFQQFSAESKALTIASVALIVTVLALLMSFMALDAAKHAKIQVEYELQATRSEISEMKERLLLTDVYLQRVHVIIESIGFDAPPLPEKK